MKTEEKASMIIIRAKPSHWHRFCDEKIGLVDSLFINTERQRPNHHRWMFEEDFARVLYSINRRSGNLFKVVSNADETLQMLLGNVKTRYAPHSVDETIGQLVEEVAKSLICFGSTYYFLHDDAEQKKVYLAPFSSAGVLRLFGTDIQWVPKRRERHWNQEDEELPRELRILDAGKIMRFDMPKPAKRMLAAQNRILALLDKHQIAEANFYYHATHENPNPTNHFDFGVWRDTQERALYRATRRTGWNGRKYDSTQRSDFFDCHRLIRFRRNQVLLRDDILNQLSVELTRVGKGYNSEFFVKISATDELPSVIHLDELKTRLTREEVGFNEIFDYC